MGDPVLQIEQLSTGYGGLVAVENASLHINAGEIVGLFGANGAGKTSTLLATVGELPRRAGEVRWCGSPARKSLRAMASAGLAFVPEKRSITSCLSTRDNLRLGSGGVGKALAYFPELEELLGRSAGLLSGGQQQILMLARALAMEPKALVVDELSLGLAPQVVDRLLLALRRAADDEGLAVLIVEQQMRRALAASDRWYLMASGKTVAGGSCDAEGKARLEEKYSAKVGIGAAAKTLPDELVAVDCEAPSVALSVAHRQRQLEAE